MRRIAITLLVLAGLTGVGPAMAAAGSWTDPSGDAEGSPIDIVAGSHGDTASAITWTMRTAQGYDNADVDVIVWTLYVDQDNEQDICIFVYQEESGLTAEVSNCAAGSHGSGSVSHSDGSDTLTLTVQRSVLAAGGLPQSQSSYRYDVFAAAAGNYDWVDVAPNSGFFTHNLGDPSPTPTPTPAQLPRTDGGDEEPTADTSTETAAPGQRVTVFGDGFQPGAELTITFRSDPVVLGKTRASTDGSYSATVAIPTNATPGMHTIEVYGLAQDGQGRAANTPIRIVAAAARSGSDALPASGAPMTSMATFAFMLVTAGEVLLGGALWATWPRRREPASRTDLYPDWEAWESWQDRRLP